MDCSQVNSLYLPACHAARTFTSIHVHAEQYREWKKKQKEKNGCIYQCGQTMKDGDEPDTPSFLTYHPLVIPNAGGWFELPFHSIFLHFLPFRCQRVSEHTQRSHLGKSSSFLSSLPDWMAGAPPPPHTSIHCCTPSSKPSVSVVEMLAAYCDLNSTLWLGE